MGNFKKEVFGTGGMLHQLFGDTYEVRHEQVNMSIAAAKAIMNREILLAEGATGVGKSFAYMIPSVSPATRKAFKGPVVISTSTKVLQDQIHNKDVPAILKATHQPLDVVLAKGRNNYVSVRRLERYQEDLMKGEVSFESQETATQVLPLLNTVSASLNKTGGEFANFNEDIPAEIKNAVESTENDCHGEDCEFYNSCPYQKAKQKRKQADILIVNHALLALHIAFGHVLPDDCSTFIIDEAHKFYDSVSTVFQEEITLHQVHRFIDTFGRKLRGLRENMKNSVEMIRLTDILNTYEHRSKRDKNKAVDFFAAAQKEICKSVRDDAIHYGFAVETPSTLKGDSLKAALDGYVRICESLQELFGVEEDDSEEDALHRDIAILSKSASEIHRRFTSILSHEDPEKWCYWAEVSLAHNNDPNSPNRLMLRRTPIDISEQITPLFEKNNAVIFTSATLQVSDSFARIRQQLGLIPSEDSKKPVTERVYRSPFPYKENVEIHLFSDTIADRPAPNASDTEKKAYLNQQACLVEYYCRLRGGRALVLCSSNKLLYELSEQLDPVLEEMGITLFRQMGTDRLKETVEAFKQDEKSVLFGVASCWEGLDAPGATLETVIIPQLPFAPPHPLTDARKNLLENPNAWFSEISLPDMLLHLKQGAGRLVRSTQDKGIIAILSPRPLTKQYGKDIRKALPPGRLVRNPKEALNYKGDSNLGAN